MKKQIVLESLLLLIIAVLAAAHASKFAVPNMLTPQPALSCLGGK